MGHTASPVAGARTLIEALRLRAEAHTDRLAVNEPLQPGSPVTYGELHCRAQQFAHRLKVVTPPGRGPHYAVIALPNGVDYVVAFFGCLAAGVVAVTLYPAMATERVSRTFGSRLDGVVRDCRPFVLIGEDDFLDSHTAALPPGLATIAVTPSGGSSVKSAGGPSRPGFDIVDTDVAMLQYTSGSTSDPKGVRLTHRNLVSNVTTVTERLGSRDQDTVVSWLPLYHDMGLIGAVLHPIWAGMSIQLFTPQEFVRRPYDWLRLTSEHRGAVLMAPNFAYELCLRRGRPTPGDRLELSSVRMALNGAEPIRPATIAAFTEVFGEHGLRRNAMTPAYGLAENTVGVSLAQNASGPSVFPALRSRLLHGRYTPAGDAVDDRVELVGCGRDLAGVTTAIVDAATGKDLPDGRVGEIWVTGDSVAAGYHGRPDETKARFDARLGHRPGRWLRTGDLGVRINGELCICGRLKDLIIQNGANHDPADIEATAVAADARAQDTAVAFSIHGTSGADEVVLLQEIARLDLHSEADELISIIRSRVAQRHGLRIHTVSLVARGQLPKTTSGKVQRGRARLMWLNGELTALASAGLSPSQPQNA